VETVIKRKAKIKKRYMFSLNILNFLIVNQLYKFGENRLVKKVRGVHKLIIIRIP